MIGNKTYVEKMSSMFGEGYIFVVMKRNISERSFCFSFLLQTDIMGNNLILLLHYFSRVAYVNICVILPCGCCKERVKFLLLASKWTAPPMGCKNCILEAVQNPSLSPHVCFLYVGIFVMVGTSQTSYISLFNNGKITFLSVFSHTNKSYELC